MSMFSCGREVNFNDSSKQWRKGILSRSCRASVLFGKVVQNQCSLNTQQIQSPLKHEWRKWKDIRFRPVRLCRERWYRNITASTMERRDNWINDRERIGLNWSLKPKSTSHIIPRFPPPLRKPYQREMKEYNKALGNACSRGLGTSCFGESDSSC